MLFLSRGKELAGPNCGIINALFYYSHVVGQIFVQPIYFSITLIKYFGSFFFQGNLMGLLHYFFSLFVNNTFKATSWNWYFFSVTSEICHILFKLINLNSSFIRLKIFKYLINVYLQNLQLLLFYISLWFYILLLYKL